MKIIKFPKMKKCPKLKIKVKCNECGTKLLIDDIHDVTRVYGRLIDAHYEVTCPYCDTMICLFPFSKESEQIDRYRKYNAIYDDDMDSREEPVLDFFGQCRHK